MTEPIKNTELTTESTSLKESTDLKVVIDKPKELENTEANEDTPLKIESVSLKENEQEKKLINLAMILTNLLSENAKIERLITTDIFGKSSTIRFSNVSTNFLVKDSEFIPVIPEGVEYIEN